MSLKLIELKKIEEIGLKKPYFIIGFPGAGLVGSIASTYLTNENDFELIGYVESEKIAPVAAVHDYKPLPPIRLMASKEKNMIVFLSEASIPLSLSLELTNLILKISRKVKAKFIIAIGGMSKINKTSKSYIIASNESAWREVEKFKIGERIREGATTGISALLLTKASLEKINMIALLVETGLDVGDPIASSKALKLISRFTDTKINTMKLEKEAKDYEKGEEETTSFGSDTSMYG